jgi:hypothetical protein
MPAPTIGRIVHYQPSSEDTDQDPLPAIIHKVYNDIDPDRDDIDITVFSEDGPTVLRNVIRSPDPHAPSPATWFWPILR